MEWVYLNSHLTELGGAGRQFVVFAAYFTQALRFLVVRGWDSAGRHRHLDRLGLGLCSRRRAPGPRVPALRRRRHLDDVEEARRHRQALLLAPGGARRRGQVHRRARAHRREGALRGGRRGAPALRPPRRLRLLLAHPPGRDGQPRAHHALGRGGERAGAGPRLVRPPVGPVLRHAVPPAAARAVRVDVDSARVRRRVPAHHGVGRPQRDAGAQAYGGAGIIRADGDLRAGRERPVEAHRLLALAGAGLRVLQRVDLRRRRGTRTWSSRRGSSISSPPPSTRPSPARG